METIIFQIVGVLSTIGLISFGIVKLFSYIKSIKWSNPFKKYVRNIVLEYLKELSKDD